MEIKGKIIKELPLQTGMGKKGEWRKQEYVLQTDGQYPKSICFSVWGDKIDTLNLGVGDEATISVELESREYNSKWYTEVRAWKVEDHKFGGPQKAASKPSGIPSELDTHMASGGATDDLPFTPWIGLKPGL